MKNERFGLLACTGVAGALLISSPAVPAEKPSVPELTRMLEEQGRQITEQQRSLEEQEKRLQAYKERLEQTLKEQQRRIDELKAQLEAAKAQPSAADSRKSPAKPDTAAQVPGAVLESERGGQAPPQPVGEAPKAEDPRTKVAQIFDTPGVLTPRGKLTLEPSLQYSHSSDSRVALVGFTIVPAIAIGTIDVREVNRDTFIAALTARYGITNRFEIEGKLPYVHRDDETRTRPLATPAITESTFDADGSGLGDVELAARYQFNQLVPDRPIYVGTLRFKSRTGEDPFEVDIDPLTGLETELPTGTGFYTVQPGLSVIFPSDPAVFFAGVNYLWNIKRSVGGGFGEVDPGDAVGINFGMGLALNERASFSVGYEHATFFGDEQSGEDPSRRIRSSTRQLGTLAFGLSYRLNQKTNFNLSVGAGVTEDAPDVQLTLRLPYTF
jgi:hypothetical protein